jgi:hypothetical protein
LKENGGKMMEKNNFERGEIENRLKEVVKRSEKV